MNPNKKLAFSIDDILCERHIRPSISSPPQSPLECVDVKYVYSKSRNFYQFKFYHENSLPSDFA